MGPHDERDCFRVRQCEQMKLPHASKARVERTKVVEYLLSSSHPDGSAKARFFIRFGFSSEKWKIFAQALRKHGRKSRRTHFRGIAVWDAL